MAKKPSALHPPIRKGEEAYRDASVEARRQQHRDREDLLYEESVNAGEYRRGGISLEEYERRRRKILDNPKTLISPQAPQLLGNVWHSPDARDTVLPVEKKKTRRK